MTSTNNNPAPRAVARERRRRHGGRRTPERSSTAVSRPAPPPRPVGDYASHTRHVEDIRDTLAETLAGIEAQAPVVP
ncbi:hypothetical protein, partial [Amycolatopsis tolypomycina]|uniref:hypothetical protein n=1 Tax=Amycolatopsis tolypomycina TaxID=208445 RepID=UPI0033A5C678